MVNKERNAGGANFGFSSQITFQNPNDAIYIVNAIASYPSAFWRSNFPLHMYMNNDWVLKEMMSAALCLKVKVSSAQGQNR